MGFRCEAASAIGRVVDVGAELIAAAGKRKGARGGGEAKARLNS